MSQHEQIPLIDAIKAVAAQIIVLHHLAWYGPMSDIAANLSPLLDSGQSWLANYGRYAVAAFLAAAGYLAARSLPLRGLPANVSPLCLVGQRYTRLVGPYAVALVLAVISAAIARRWMNHESIGTVPDVWQFIAHVFLLHDVLDFEALSAGVWYIAIDFQLYALLVVLLWGGGWLGHRTASTDFSGPAIVAAVACASLFHFNRVPEWDDTALYFFGLYALGASSRWATSSRSPHRALLLIGLIGSAALSFDFRPRLAVALTVSLMLGLAQLHWKTSGIRLLEKLGRTSYALFLVHFPICLLINTLIHRLAPDNPQLNMLGVMLAWGASNAAAFLFHRHVEIRLTPWLAGFLTCRRFKPG